ncbi:hypothetical protein FNV43_RR27039 [Rhamnella rubrinervis]|uniref:Uncharacterized protein n=1 Tax=Rhamnella rubrinervis TaxID=2594499 RepID=A0A8K0DQ93_9ROSA|nr:hypothetical protein FNV43_RR27039 [Rhamnella rubrinervis]
MVHQPEFPTEESRFINENAPNEHQIMNNQGGHVEEAENDGGGTEMENVGISLAKKTAKGKITSPYDALCRKLFHEFVTKIGVMMGATHHSILRIGDVSVEVRTQMIDFLKESFEFNEDVVTMSALDAQMRRSFRTWRYMLYEKVKKAHKEEDIATIKPEHI